jgi:hypothetical protein
MVAKFLVRDSGIQLTLAEGCRTGPARLRRLAGMYDNPMPESTISPMQSGTKNLTTGLFVLQILLPGDSPQELTIR